MQLTVQVLSPFCRKTVAAIRLRRDPVDIVELGSPFEAERDAFGAQPLLLTDWGACTSAGEILAFLHDRRRSGPTLLPPDRIVACGDLDRLLDLYLLEPAILLASEARCEATVRATYTAMRTLDLIEDRLADGRRYLLGNELGWPDLTGLVGVTDVARHGVVLPDAVESWVRRLRMHQVLDEVVEEADAVWAMRGALDGAARLRAA